MATGFMTRPEQKQEQDKAMDAFAYHQMVAHVDNVQPPVLQPCESHPFDSPVTIPGLCVGVCSNAVERQCVYFEGPEPCQDLAEVWRRLDQFCRRCEIRQCENEDCTARKARLRLVAPEGGCKEFREWALAVLACQAGFAPEQRTSVAFRHLANAALDCVRVIGSCANNSRQIEYHVKDQMAIPMMLAELCNQVYWMISIQADYGIAPRELGSLSQEFMPSVAYTAALERARGRLARQRLCKRHIWNLVQSSERKEAELLDLSESIRPLARKFEMKGHELCALSKCQLAHRNSTNTTQLHKCSAGYPCREINLPMQLIGEAVEQGHPTAWHPDGEGLCKEGEGYVAISHVWSDGTGGGGKRPGTVNTCLFDFFRDAAKPDGFWWDTICIPSESKARNRALERMHSNYRHAKHTLVHDHYLLNFEWADDGSPCLAIAMSPWFSRGWTALELAVSRRVKVLFGDGHGSWVAKDLDDDILPAAPSSVPRAYWLAANLIRRVRQPIHDVGDLLAILRPRSTAWVRDQTVILALLARVPRCDLSRSEVEITQDILDHVGYIPKSCLLHSAPTICDQGPFSWCPATLNELSVDTTAGPQLQRAGNQDHRLLRITGGAVHGTWRCRPVNRVDIEGKSIHPLSDDLGVRLKIQAALEKWTLCSLLHCTTDNDSRRCAILVLRRAEGSGQQDQIRGRYVGTVRISTLGTTKDLPSQWPKRAVILGGKDDAYWVPIEETELMRYMRISNEAKCDQRLRSRCQKLFDALREARGAEHTPAVACLYRQEFEARRSNWTHQPVQYLLEAVRTGNERALRHLISKTEIGELREREVTDWLCSTGYDRIRHLQLMMRALLDQELWTEACEYAQAIWVQTVYKRSHLQELVKNQQPLEAWQDHVNHYEARLDALHTLLITKLKSDNLARALQYCDILIDDLQNCHRWQLRVYQGVEHRVDSPFRFLDAMQRSVCGYEALLRAECGDLTEADTALQVVLNTEEDGGFASCVFGQLLQGSYSNDIQDQEMMVYHYAHREMAQLLGREHPLAILLEWNLHQASSDTLSDGVDVVDLEARYDKIILAFTGLLGKMCNLIRYVRYFYGNSLQSHGKVSEARAQYRKALDGFPQSLGQADAVWVGLQLEQGVCLIHEQQLGEAKLCFDAAWERVQSIKPPLPVIPSLRSRVTMCKAWLFFLDGHTVEAVKLGCELLDGYYAPLNGEGRHKGEHGNQTGSVVDGKMDELRRPDAPDGLESWIDEEDYAASQDDQGDDNVLEPIETDDVAYSDNESDLRMPETGLEYIIDSEDEDTYLPISLEPEESGSRSAVSEEDQTAPPFNADLMIAQIQICLGIMYAEQKNFVEAQKMIEESIVRFKRTVGREDIRSLAAEYRLALVYRHHGTRLDRLDMVKKARTHLEDVAKLRYKVPGPFHTPVLEPLRVIEEIDGYKSHLAKGHSAQYWSDRYEAVQQDNQILQQEHGALQEKYRRLEEQYTATRQTHEHVQRDQKCREGALRDKYTKVEKDLIALTSVHDNQRRAYKELQNKYNTMRNRLEYVYDRIKRAQTIARTDINIIENHDWHFSGRFKFPKNGSDSDRRMIIGFILSAALFTHCFVNESWSAEPSDLGQNRMYEF